MVYSSVDPYLNTTCYFADKDEPASSLIEDDGDCEDQDEESEDEDEAVGNAEKMRASISGRGVTLSMLISDGIIEPGEGLMSIDYLVWHILCVYQPKQPIFKMASKKKLRIFLKRLFNFMKYILFCCMLSG